ncbi:protein kinase domain-containing protein [Exilibacterium tricleocarpae]|nr:protein kinase [Exilibacterium tricleocarpae]
MTVYCAQASTELPLSAPADGPDIPGYSIEERLGRGGTAVVYRAKDLRLNRTVAIKMLSSDHMSHEQVKRLQLEARAVGALHHPNIIQIYSVGEHHGQPYLVLEYATGGTLHERLTNDGFEPQVVLAMMLTLVNAIAFIHANGFLHRDLKPSNILFDHNGTLKISDFGLAKDTSGNTELTQTQSQLGTPAYMAPEQIDAHFGKVDQRSDIYSLGVLMHGLLTHITPYHGLSATGLIKELISKKPVPSSRLLDKCADKALIAVCLRCLEKNPKHRYSSASALYQDLLRVKSGKAVSRKPWYRQLVRRSVGVAASMLVLLTISVAAWQQKTPAVTPPGFLSGKTIATLDSSTLTAINVPLQGESDYKLIRLLPEGLEGTNLIQLNAAQGLALYQGRYLAIADTLNHRVLTIDLQSGDIALVAGNGEASYSGDNGPAISATLNQPVKLDFDSRGRLYIADRANHAVRRIDNEGTITTVAGGIGCKEKQTFSTIPMLCYPGDVSITPNADIYIADTFNERIRLVEPGLDPATVFRRQPADTPPDFNPFPRAMDYHNNTLYFIGGVGGQLHSISETGTAKAVAGGFVEPTDISVDKQGRVYISDEAGFPLTRFDPDTDQVQVIDRSQLTYRNKLSPPIDQISALVVGEDNKLFFSDRVNNAINVIIPNNNRSPLPMTARHTTKITRDYQQYPHPQMDTKGQYSFVDSDEKTFFSTIAYRLGLQPYMHQSSLTQQRVFFSENDISARNALTLYCFYVAYHCGLQGNTLFIARPAAFAQLTTAKPLTIDDPLSFIGNADAMPESWKRDAERTVFIAPGAKRIIEEFFPLLESSSVYRYEFDASMRKIIGDAKFAITGTYNLGQLHAAIVLRRKARLEYNEQSGKLVVRAFGN